MTKQSTKKENMGSSESEEASKRSRFMVNAASITVEALKSNPLGTENPKKEQTFGKSSNMLIVQQKNNLTKKMPAPKTLFAKDTRKLDPIESLTLKTETESNDSVSGEGTPAMKFKQARNSSLGLEEIKEEQRRIDFGNFNFKG